MYDHDEDYHISTESVWEQYGDRLLLEVGVSDERCADMSEHLYGTICLQIQEHLAGRWRDQKSHMYVPAENARDLAAALIRAADAIEKKIAEIKLNEKEGEST